VLCAGGGCVCTNASLGLGVVLLTDQQLHS